MPNQPAPFDADQRYNPQFLLALQNDNNELFLSTYTWGNDQETNETILQVSSNTSPYLAGYCNNIPKKSCDKTTVL